MSFGDFDKKDYGVSVQLPQLYNKKLSHSTLRRTMWGKGNNVSLILQFHPELPQSKQTEKNVYDYDTFLQVVLNQAKTYKLYKTCNRICKCINNGSYDFPSQGITTATGSICIMPANKLEYLNLPEDFNGIALVIYSKVNGEGIAEQSLCYVFNKSESTILNYTGTGEFDLEEPEEDEFELFTLSLKSAVEAMTKIPEFSTKNSIRYFENTVRSSLKALKEKAGLVGQQGYNTYAQGNKYNYGNRTNNSANDYFTPVGNTNMEIPETNNLPQVNPGEGEFITSAGLPGME